MFKTIMVPIDLAHLDKIKKSLQVAADLATHYDATVHYVAVTAAVPSPVAHNPHEFAEKLERFVAEQRSTHGIKAEAHPVTSHDPTADLDTTLNHAGEAMGADLVVMASHVPGFADHIFHTHGGYVASHSSLSVFVIR